MVCHHTLGGMEGPGLPKIERRHHRTLLLDACKDRAAGGGLPVRAPNRAPRAHPISMRPLRTRRAPTLRSRRPRPRHSSRAISIPLSHTPRRRALLLPRLRQVEVGKHRKRLPRPTIAEIKRQRRERGANDQPRWWEKDPTIAGERCTTAQSRLGVVHAQDMPLRARQMGAVSGDFCADPIRAEGMLVSRSHAQLTIPGRAADFRTEVEWRLRLRSGMAGSRMDFTLRDQSGAPATGAPPPRALPRMHNSGAD